MKERTWLKESLEVRQRGRAQQEDVLRDTRTRHPNGPLDFQSLAFLNSATEKAEISGSPHAFTVWHPAAPC